MAENKADAQVLKMLVTDGDEPHSAAWNAKFTIVSGDPEGRFSVKTGTNKQEGILSTVKVHLSHNGFGALPPWFRKIRPIVVCPSDPSRGSTLKRPTSTPC